MKRFRRNLISILAARELQIDPGILTKTSRIQLFYGAWVNMAQLAIGLAFGFASVQIPQLSRPESEIQITVVDASWIVSAVPLMVPIGCVISGFVMDWAGRRSTLIFCQVPMFVGWLYTALAETPKNIIIGRAITGVACGMAMGPSRAYGTEIALPNMRGVIGAFPNLASSLGITLTAVLDKFFPWYHVCYICSSFSFINFCTFVLLPETPYFILQSKTESEARANLALFRGKNYNIEKEMNELIDFKQENNLRKLSLMGSLGMLFTKASCKPFTLMMIYNLIAQTAGVSILLFWTIDLLEKSKSSFDLQTGNILMGVTRVVMGLFTSLLLYRYGRRPLAMISAIGVTIVCCAFGLTLMSMDKPSVTPQVSLMVYVVFASLGYYTLPFLMAFELYPLQVRGILGGATISINSLMVFASTKMNPLMLDSLGISNMFIAFGLFSFIGCVFIFFWLPETKDLTLQEIEEYYKDMRPTLSSQRRLQSMNQLANLSGPSSRNKTKANLDRLKSASRITMLAQLEAQKKLAALIEKEVAQQLRSSMEDGSTQGTKVGTDHENVKLTDIKKYEEKDRETIKSTDSKKYEDRDRDSTKSTDSKKYEDRDRDSTKSTDFKKSRGITFSDNEENNKDNENIKRKKSAESIKSQLKVIYEAKRDKIYEKKKDKDTPKNEKRDKETPRDEKRDKETPKDEKRDKEIPKDEKRDKETPKDEKRDEETPKDEKRDKETPKDEKRDEETPKDEDQPSSSKKNA